MMPTYRDALKVDDASSDQRLALAAGVLDRCEGIVMLGDAIALEATPAVIYCRVIDPMPNGHRCAEEFKVLVENARRELACSRLSHHLPRRPYVWSMVEECGLE